VVGAMPWWGCREVIMPGVYQVKGHTL